MNTALASLNQIASIWSSCAMAKTLDGRFMRCLPDGAYGFAGIAQPGKHIGKLGPCPNTHVRDAARTIAFPGERESGSAPGIQNLHTIYDQAWIAPPDITDESLTAQAIVVIARNGQIISAKIIHASGDSDFEGRS